MNGAMVPPNTTAVAITSRMLLNSRKLSRDVQDALAKSSDVAASKAFVKWLWVTKTDFQLDFVQSYGFHIPARQSLAEKATKLKSGVAADAVKLSSSAGKAQTPLLWTPPSGQAYTTR